MKQINFNDVEVEIRNGSVVVAEYTTIGADNQIIQSRGIVHQVMAKRKVNVLHGNVNANFFYSFDNAREAQEFINAV